MVYVTSDLHGLELTKLKALLKKAYFNENDWLFVLGDVIDRQNDGGVAILRWLLEQPNAQLILGNHEAMLLSCDFVFNEITEESIRRFGKEQMDLLNNYMLNGGDVTLNALRKLKNDSPETLNDIIGYLKEVRFTKPYTQEKRIFCFAIPDLIIFHPKETWRTILPMSLSGLGPNLPTVILMIVLRFSANTDKKLR